MYYENLRPRAQYADRMLTQIDIEQAGPI